MTVGSFWGLLLTSLNPKTSTPTPEPRPFLLLLLLPLLLLFFLALFTSCSSVSLSARNNNTVGDTSPQKSEPDANPVFQNFFPPTFLLLFLLIVYACFASSRKELACRCLLGGGTARSPLDLEFIFKHKLTKATI